MKGWRAHSPSAWMAHHRPQGPRGLANSDPSVLGTGVHLAWFLPTAKGGQPPGVPPPSSVDTLPRLGKLRALKTDYGQDSGSNSFPIPFPHSSPKPTLMPGLSVPILHPLTRPALWNPKSSLTQNCYLSLSLSPLFPGQVHRHHPSHPDRYFQVFSEARTGQTSSIETQ